MHPPSLIGILIIAAIALLLFGRPGRISGLMEDLGKGLRGFKKGLDGDQPGRDEKPPQIVDKTRDDERTSV